MYIWLLLATSSGCRLPSGNLLFTFIVMRKISRTISSTRFELRRTCDSDKIYPTQLHSSLLVSTPSLSSLARCSWPFTVSKSKTLTPLYHAFTPFSLATHAATPQNLGIIISFNTVSSIKIHSSSNPPTYLWPLELYLAAMISRTLPFLNLYSTSLSDALD